MPRLYYGSVLSDGVRIHYYRTGEEKPPVVLLHGITDNGLCWNRTALMLEPDFDVVMVDARGHGLSDAPDTGYDYYQQAADTAAVIEQLDLQRPVVMGHSMGAQTAAILAARFPLLVKSLVLEDPPWEDNQQDTDARQKWAAQVRDNVMSFRERSEAELVELGKNIHPTWDAGDIQMWARSKKQVRPEIAHIADQPRPDWREFVGDIRCPLLLFTADQDKGALVSPGAAAYVARLVRKCYVLNVPGAGHNIRRDQFDPFFDAVSTFLTL